MFELVAKDECEPSEVVLVHGLCGRGKAPIVAGSNELDENALKAASHVVKRFNGRFESMIDGDASILPNKIPALTNLLLKGSNNNTRTAAPDSTQDVASVTQAFNRLKQLWRSMLSVIACCTNAVILFLDNLQ